MPAELKKIHFILDETPEFDMQMDRATVGKERGTSPRNVQEAGVEPLRLNQHRENFRISNSCE